MPISFDDFQKIDLHIGTIIHADFFAKAKKPAYKLTIDFGPLGIKKSSAQITSLYSIDRLVGSQIIAVTNFPPKQIADMMSECLVLGAINKDGSIVLLRPDSPVDNGLKIG